jgi:UDP-glucuronate 4-epimerase
MVRDFTYIDDVIESIYCLIEKLPSKEDFSDNKNYDSSNSWAPYRVFNIGNSQPTDLNKYIEAIEKNLNKKADIILEKMQPGDVEKTFANTENLEKWIKFKPNTSIEEGIKNFVDWYLTYYEKKKK